MLWALKDEVPAQVRENDKIHFSKMPNHGGQVVTESAICNVNVYNNSLDAGRVPIDAGCSPDERLGAAVNAVFCFRIKATSLFRTFLS